MMDMEKIEDIRTAIRLLLDAQKFHQVRSLTSTTVLETIMRLSPQDRAALTREKLAPQIAQARLQAENAVAKASAQLEQVLSSDKNFLPALQMYASQKLRD